jgi:hypothetical protein
VLAGDFYHEELESVPEQTWSSAAFLTAAVQGLLGLRVDGVARQLNFTPHLPLAWDQVTLRRIRVGDSRVTLNLKQEAGEITLHVDSEGPALRMSFDPELPLGARVQSAQIGERGIAATVAQHPQDTHAHVDFEVPRGEMVVRISYSGGVKVVSPAARPTIGESSRAPKIVSVSLEDRAYTIAIDHLAAAPARFELHTPWKIASVQGAKFAIRAPSSYELEIAASAEREPRAYQRASVVVTFESVE